MGCPMSRRFCETWELRIHGISKFPGLATAARPGAPISGFQQGRPREMFVHHRHFGASCSNLCRCPTTFTELTAPETCTFSPLVAITASVYSVFLPDATCS